MRRRSAVLAVLALLAIVAVLAWLALREGSVADGSDPATTATRDELARGRDTPPRPRARAAAAENDTASAQADASGSAEPLHVDGWPAAEVIVRRADGAPEPYALVYVIPAGEPSPKNLDLIMRRKAGPDGRVRFPVAAAGRYDVGATGDVFETIVPDVEFPARAPVEIVLPDLVPLEIRKEGDVPGDGWVTIARAAATRIAANPGQSESRYVCGHVKDLGARVLVPRGVPLRVRTTPGLVASPEVVEAPGPVTLRAKPHLEVDVEFVLVPDAALATKRLQIPFAFETVPGDPESLDEGTVCLGPPPAPNNVRARLPCPPTLTRVRWRVGANPGREGASAIDGAAVQRGRPRRIEVPLARGDVDIRGFRVTAPESSAWEDLRVVGPSGRLFAETDLAAGEEYWFAPDASTTVRGSPIAAGARSADGWFVAGPTAADPGGIADLRLVPGGVVRVRWRPPEIVGDWPLRVSVASPAPFADFQVHDPRVALVPEAEILGPSALLGPFPAGDVEFVFRFGGREVGRRKVRVGTGPSAIDVEAPEILPPTR